MDLPAFKADRGLTLVELAKLLELPITTTHAYVTGFRKVEDPERVRRIVAATGGHVTAADLRPDWAAAFA